MTGSLRSLTAAAIVVGALALSATSGSATPVASGLAMTSAISVSANTSSIVENVQFRRGGHGGRGYGGRGFGWGGAGAGLVAGAIIGGALAAPYYYRPYYGPSYGASYYDAPVYAPAPVYAAPRGGDAVDYCLSRFRSYDPRTGTYMGYDGYRHACP